MDPPQSFQSTASPSPLRYPGGKAWLIPAVVDWVNSQTFIAKAIIEPFGGGANVGLFLLMEEMVETLVLGELDHKLAAFWETVLQDGPWFADEIIGFRPSKRNLMRVLRGQPTTKRQLAFQTLLRNRTSRGGIIANGGGLLNRGEQEKGAFSRWYPETLAGRILRIHSYRRRITFAPSSAFTLIRNRRLGQRNLFFIDPPYSVTNESAGRRLYDHHKINHEQLFAAVSRLRGAALITYENSHKISRLAREYEFSYVRIPMRNSHHENMKELLISKSPT